MTSKQIFSPSLSQSSHKTEKKNTKKNIYSGKKQAHLGIWDLRRREALIVNRNIFEFRGPRCTTDPSKLYNAIKKLQIHTVVVRPLDI